MFTSWRVSTAIHLYPIDKLTTLVENKTYAKNYLIRKANNYHTMVKNYCKKFNFFELRKLSVTFFFYNDDVYKK